ncbi:hypothetical protein BH18ACT13_BH18ACT13_12070 [soil metagenome]
MAALGDVHGNCIALVPVLEELAVEDVDLVWTGDLSWGSEPSETPELVRSLDAPARYVRENGERALLDLRDGRFEAPTEREAWMLAPTQRTTTSRSSFEHSTRWTYEVSVSRTSRTPAAKRRGAADGDADSRGHR